MTAKASIFDPEPIVDGPFGFEARNCASRFILRGGMAIKAAGLAFGVPIPTAAMTATMNGRRAALWLGPDEWLLLSDDAENASLEASIRLAIGDAPHALVDVSHRQGAILIAGTLAERGLNVAVPLDLSSRVFPINHCTRTIFEKTEIVLWRRSERCFQIEAGRSFLPYVTRYLMLIAEEIGVSHQ